MCSSAGTKNNLAPMCSQPRSCTSSYSGRTLCSLRSAPRSSSHSKSRRRSQTSMFSSRTDIESGRSGLSHCLAASSSPSSCLAPLTALQPAGFPSSKGLSTSGAGEFSTWLLEGSQLRFLPNLQWLACPRPSFGGCPALFSYLKQQLLWLQWACELIKSI